MGLLFFPRGGSAQAARYLSTALVAAGWSVELVTGSLGESGDDTHAPTFFADAGVHYLDYSEALRMFAMGGSAIGAAVPMHPSFEDREGAPDVVLAAVPVELAAASVHSVGGAVPCRWGGPGRCLSSTPLDAPARGGAPLLARGCHRRPPPRHRDQVLGGRQ